MNGSVEYNYSDGFYRYIILVTFILFYIFLSFTNKKLIGARLNNENMHLKCNPIDLVVSSIFTPDNAGDDLQKCIELNNNNLLQKYGSNINDLVSDTSEGLLKKCKNIVNSSKVNSHDLITESDADEIRTDIEKISDTITDISNNLVSNIEESKNILSNIIKNIN
tara:strand:- start:130 stop:624 length:495 start_codon:yes stop_codon:yes gene_type:complete